jgi:hypothetical protein
LFHLSETHLFVSTSFFVNISSLPVVYSYRPMIRKSKCFVNMRTPIRYCIESENEDYNTLSAQKRSTHRLLELQLCIIFAGKITFVHLERLG